MKSIAAACQFESKTGDVEGNLDKATQFTYEAAAKGANIIVLPELCISGWYLNSRKQAAEMAQTADGYQTGAFLPIIERFGCYIVFGYVELYEGKLYNSANLLGPNTCIPFRKRNLWGSDYMWATPGDQAVHRIVHTPYGRLGVLVCRDVCNRSEKAAKEKKAEGAFYHHGSCDVVAVPVAWDTDGGYPDVSWMELAETLGVNVVVANQPGREKRGDHRGCSAIINPTGKVWRNGWLPDADCVVGGMIRV